MSYTTLEFFGLPEAPKDYVAILINNNVTRLEVTVDDTRCVQGLNTLDGLCGVKVGAVMAKTALAV